MATMAALILFFFIYQIGQYANWQKPVQENHYIWNLSKEQVKWDVFYGQSAQCGDSPCQFSSDHKQVTKQMVLPAREFPLLDWKKNQKIYLSASLNIPDLLLKFDEPLVIYSAYIWAEKYTFYLNQKPFHAGGKETVFITLPKEILSKTIDLAFEIDPGNLPYQGLANKIDLLIGPKSLLSRQAYSSHEYLTTYQLWFLVPKLILCFFFIALFIGFYRFKEIRYLVYFLLASALTNYVRSDYYPTSLNAYLDGRVADHLVFSFSQIALLMFVHEYFRRYSKIFNFLIRTAVCVLVFCSGLFLVSSEAQALWLRSEFFTKIGQVLYYSAYMYGTFLSAVTAFYLREKGINGFRAITAQTLYIVFGALTLFLMIFELFGYQQITDPYYFQNVGSMLLIFTFAASVLIEFGIALPQRNLIKGLFTKFIHKKVLKDALKSEELLIPRKRNIVTLVVDIRGFSSYCELRSPEEVVATLVSVRNLITESAQAFYGLVDKFTGDGALLIFGVIDSNRNYAMDSIQASFMLLQNFQRQLGGIQSVNGQCLRLGIGVSSGDAIVGAIGSDAKTEYTALGHSVNMAFRLEDLTKALNMPFVIDTETFASVSKRVIVCMFKDQKVKGIEKRVVVYGLIAYLGEEDEWISISPEYDCILKNLKTAAVLLPEEIMVLNGIEKLKA